MPTPKIFTKEKSKKPKNKTEPPISTPTLQNSPVHFGLTNASHSTNHTSTQQEQSCTIVWTPKCTLK